MTDSQPLPFWDTIYQDATANDVFINTKASLIIRLWQLRRGIRNRPGFACVFWFRINHLIMKKGWRGGHWLRVRRQYRFASNISPWATIGPGLFLPNPVDVMIGSSVVIGKNAGIYNGVTIEGTAIQGKPCLGDNVRVYTGAKVLGTQIIGNNVVIGALTLCKQDVPPDSILYGVPPHMVLVNKDFPHRRSKLSDYP